VTFPRLPTALGALSWSTAGAAREREGAAWRCPALVRALFSQRHALYSDVTRFIQLIKRCRRARALLNEHRHLARLSRIDRPFRRACATSRNVQSSHSIWESRALVSLPFPFHW
jgi:hypothetical protein